MTRLFEGTRRFAADLAEGFRGYAGRYLLAAFAVTMGIMTFAMLVLIIAGVQTRVDQITAEFGADVVSIVREESLSGMRQGLSMDQVDMIRDNYPAMSVAPLRTYQATTLDSPDPVSVIATGPDLVEIRGWTVREGRNLDERDLLGKARVLVASRRMRDDAGWHTGRIVFIDSEPFFVIGMVDPDGLREGSGSRPAGVASGERFALIPWSSAMVWRGERHDIGRRLERILLKGRAEAGEVVESIQNLFAGPDADPGRVSWVTARQLVADLERLRKTVLLGVGSIAGLCLLLGGTTLMSLMVLNVRERIPEIGLRLSLGARRYQISTLFVVEAMLVTAVAGVAGTLLAHAMAGAFGSRLPVSIEPGLSSTLLPAALALVLGALFSWWPARIASRITPSEAIRSD